MKLNMSYTDSVSQHAVYVFGTEEYYHAVEHSVREEHACLKVGAGCSDRALQTMFRQQTVNMKPGLTSPDL